MKVEAPHKFITGEILARDPWRIELLEFLAIAEKQSGEALSQPHETIAIANEFAAAGMQDLLARLTDGTSQAIWNLTDSLLDPSLGTGES